VSGPKVKKTIRLSSRDGECLLRGMHSLCTAGSIASLKGITRLMQSSVREFPLRLRPTEVRTAMLQTILLEGAKL